MTRVKYISLLMEPVHITILC